MYVVRTYSTILFYCVNPLRTAVDALTLIPNTLSPKRTCSSIFSAYTSHPPIDALFVILTPRTAVQYYTYENTRYKIGSYPIHTALYEKIHPGIFYLLIVDVNSNSKYFVPITDLQFDIQHIYIPPADRCVVRSTYTTYRGSVLYLSLIHI